MEVQAWLQKLKLGKYEDTFAQHGFNSLDVVRGITAEDLDRMEITLAGHRTRILKNLPNEEAPPPIPQRPSSADDFGLDGVLGNLNSMIGDLDQMATGDPVSPMLPPKPAGDGDLDALLDDLCSFGTDDSGMRKEEVQPPLPSRNSRGSIAGKPAKPYSVFDPSVDLPENAPPPRPAKNEEKLAPQVAESPKTSPKPIQRTKTSMRPKPSPEKLEQQLADYRKQIVSQHGSLNTEELDQMLREEKVRIAMEKMAEANIQQCVLKIFIDDVQFRTVDIVTNQTAFTVTNLVVNKQRVEEDPNWAIVEQCPSLHIERILEDHEKVGEAYNMWPPTSDYRFEFRKLSDKYGLFTHPDNYFPNQIRDDLKETGASVSERTERAKRVLMQEYFSNTHRIPDIKSYLQEKEGAKKWKKRFFMLRSTGIYYSTKGDSEASKDLVCYVKFADYDFCTSYGEFKKAYKAPTEYCLCFRPRLRKQMFGLDDIKAVACSDLMEFKSWWAGVRLAMYGMKLREDYEDTIRKFDALVKAGRISKASTNPLVASLRKRPEVHETNKDMIDQWKHQRSSRRRPGQSAATGAKWDEGNGEPLMEHKWYHGALSRDDAEALLKAANFREGSFLVRSSTSHPGDYVLCVAFAGSPKHFHIRKWLNPGGAPQFSIDDGERFVDLEGLILHYHEPDDRLPVKLGFALPRRK